MHALLTGERDGYYQDYGDAPARRVAETMAFGFGYQGAPSAYRGGKRRGEPSAHLPPTAFIDFLQNHDQVGNRADGERLDSLVTPEAVEASLALLLLSPHIPLLFMGEEYGERAKFYFFTDFQGELAEAVRKGRNEEFRTNKAFTEAFRQDLVPDPNAFDTFAASKLDATRTSHEAAAETRARFVKSLLKTRFAHIVPKLAAAGSHAGKVEAVKNDAFVVSWLLDGGSTLTLFANLGGRETRICAESTGAIVFAHPPAAKSALAQHRLPAWSVIAVMGNQS
jgi:maltooligosyltrehalose trehalohydrolase